MRVAGGVLVDGQQPGHAGAAREYLSHAVAGRLGRDHGDVHVVGGLDGVVVDVEAVREHERLPRQQVGRDGLAIDLGLQVVGDEHHHDVRVAGDIGHQAHFQAVLFGLGHAAAALVQPHLHVYAAVVQVERVGVALAAVSDYADGLAVQQGHVGVVFVVHFDHGSLQCVSFSVISYQLSVVRGWSCVFRGFEVRSLVIRADSILLISVTWLLMAVWSWSSIRARSWANNRRYSSSLADPMAISRNLANSAALFLPQPSAMLVGTDAAARRSWLVSP